MGLANSAATYWMRGKEPPNKPKDSEPHACTAQCSCPSYGDRYLEHLDEYLFDAGAYAA